MSARAKNIESSTIFIELGQRPDEPGPPIQGTARYPADVTSATMPPSHIAATA